MNASDVFQDGVFIQSRQVNGNWLPVTLIQNIVA